MKDNEVFDGKNNEPPMSFYVGKRAGDFYPVNDVGEGEEPTRILPKIQGNEEPTSKETSEAIHEEIQEESTDEILPTYTKNTVREIDRLPPEYFAGGRKKPAKKRLFTPKLSFGAGAKVGLFILFFAFAAGAGFLAAGYARENSAETLNHREERRQALNTRQKEIADREAELIREQQRLEAETKILEARKEALAKEENRLTGKTEQLYADKSDSFFGRLLDKVTGKEKERQESIIENERQKEAAIKDGDEADRALKNAREALDEVNEKLAAAQEMKKDLDTVKRQVEAAYVENKDTIDAAVYYIKSGAKAVKELVSDKNDEETKE